MPIDRKLWQAEISAEHVPNWPCPGCGAASLTLVKDSFHTVSDGSTSRNWRDPDFEPEFATGRFVCLLECTKSGCQETCAVSGNHDITQGGEYGEHWYPTGRPKSINPPPPMIQIPRACPGEVRAEVVAAFSLYWSDYASSLNRIRNALELVLTDLGVSRGTMSAKKPKPGSPPPAPGDPPPKKKLSRLSLHQRIEGLAKEKPKLKDICERMMAVKHLGNAGSHPGVQVEIGDVFDGLDILERVLQDMYSEHPRELTRTVRQINQRKGPRKKDGA
jgi:hypothetical protein